jgi:hypothetical protein
MSRHICRPQCCGKPMTEITSAADRTFDVHSWRCAKCQRTTQSLPVYDDEPRRRKAAPLPPQHKRKNRSGSRHPVMFGIVPRASMFEARVPSGKGGRWRYIGLYRTLHEAIAARDRALGQ